MVDGAYMGRGDKTKVKLSDTEVRRLHQMRAQAEEEVARPVDHYVSRDPVPVEDRKQAHVFVVAVPLRPRPEMLLAARPNGQWQPLLHRLLDTGAHTAATVLARTETGPNSGRPGGRCNRLSHTRS